MQLQDFIDAVAAHTQLTDEQIRKCLHGIRETCRAEIAATGKTRIPQLAEIKIAPVAERIVRNPKTGQEWLEPESTRVVARAMPIFVRRVKGEK